MEIKDSQNKAVNDIIEMIVAVIGKGSREVDTTEAISSAARLAGSFMFRSFEFDIDDVKPGTAMLSNEANTMGPALVNITLAVLQHYDIEIDQNSISAQNQTTAESDFVDVISRVQGPALEIMKKNDLNYEQLAQSAAVATAFIIQQSSNIKPEDGFGIAVYHYIEGTKTCPPKFNDQPQQNKSQNVEKENKSKPWWKFW